jgi:hypothetical protein
MVTRLKPLDPGQIQTSTVRRRTYRLKVDHLAGMPRPTEPLQEFYRTLPRVGAASELLEAAQLLARTILEARPVAWLVDGELFRAGLSPQLVYLMRRGLVQCVAVSGEVAVMDYELAFHGATCEEREAGLADGLLGLTRETGEGINSIINEGVKRGFSIGECLGRGILERQPRWFAGSVLATGAARLIPVTVHLCLGADGFQRFPGADGAMLGKGSLKDGMILSSFLAGLPAGALIVGAHRDGALGQVLLHAYALARNLNEAIGGLNALSLGDGAAPELRELPGVERRLELGGPLGVMMPLLMGALFSLVE